MACRALNRQNLEKIDKFKITRFKNGSKNDDEEM